MPEKFSVQAKKINIQELNIQIQNFENIIISNHIFL